MSHNDNQQTNPTCSIQPQVGFALVVILRPSSSSSYAHNMRHAAHSACGYWHAPNSSFGYCQAAHSSCGYWHARSFSQKLLAGKRVVEIITASAQQLVGRCHKPQRIGKPQSHLHIMRGEQDCLARGGDAPHEKQCLTL